MSSIDVKRYYVIPFRASMSRGGLDRQGHTGKRSVLTIVGEVHRYLPQWTATDHDRPQWAATDYSGPQRSTTLILKLDPIVRENVCNKAKRRKSHVFSDFEKKRKNVKT